MLVNVLTCGNREYVSKTNCRANQCNPILPETCCFIIQSVAVIKIITSVFDIEICKKVARG